VVASPSGRRETLAVAQGAFQIVFWTALLIAVERGDARSRLAAPALGLGEIAFAELASADQRVFRALREGLGEAEIARAAGGEWPSVAELADQGVPPFAADPLDREGYRWERLRQGRVTNYLGVARPGSKRPSFLAVIQEPEPGLPADPQAKPDDVHHRLPDGTMLHVTIWRGPALGPSPVVLAVPPIERGWSAIVVGR
jgi:hypothetical protein